MQIQLKQTEIVTALKQYIATQGISLAGKTVDISFTAGRKESGVVADISIEDADIPGFTNPVEEEKKAPELKVVNSNPEAKPEQKAAPAETPVQQEPAVAAEKATTSLFN